MTFQELRPKSIFDLHDSHSLANHAIKNEASRVYSSKAVSIDKIDFNLHETRRQFTATLLRDDSKGKSLLVTGGHKTEKFNDGAPVSNTGEIFTFHRDNSVTVEKSSTAIRMNTERWGHRATEQKDGKIVVIGGGKDHTIDLFDPKTKTFIPVGTLNDARSGAEQIRLPDGKIFIVGGYNKNPGATGALNTTEMYDPKLTTSIRAESTQASRVGHALALHKGKVFIVGGSDPKSTEIEVFDPKTQKIEKTGIVLPFPVKDFSFHQRDNHLYIVGGTNGLTKQSSDQILHIDLKERSVMPLTAKLSIGREDMTIVASSDKKRLLVLGGEIKGGNRDGETCDAVDLIDLSKDTAIPLPIKIARDDARAINLGGGSHLIVGGTAHKSGELGKGMYLVNLR